MSQIDVDLRNQLFVKAADSPPPFGGAEPPYPSPLRPPSTPIPNPEGSSRALLGRFLDKHENPPGRESGCFLRAYRDADAAGRPVT